MVAVAQLATSDIWQATDNPWLLSYAFNYMTTSDVKHNKRCQNSSMRWYIVRKKEAYYENLDKSCEESAAPSKTNYDK